MAFIYTATVDDSNSTADPSPLPFMILDALGFHHCQILRLYLHDRMRHRCYTIDPFLAPAVNTIIRLTDLESTTLTTSDY